VFDSYFALGAAIGLIEELCRDTAHRRGARFESSRRHERAARPTKTSSSGTLVSVQRSATASAADDSAVGLIFSNR